jgi:dihydrofolate synthase/folylpolyglutamate synthase
MLDAKACEDLLFKSYTRVAPTLKGYDSETRDLAAMEELFDRLELPKRLAPTITVTGSKGKGSTALLCSAMLQGMGYTVGLLTSPGFLSVRERIRVNGQAIAEADFVRIVNELAPAIVGIDETLPQGKYLSPTGLFLACALRRFSESGVTTMVLEVGRGGRFDDVRLAENAVACITPVMEEHLDKLGPTLQDVAWHKAGIITPGCAVVSAPQPASVEAVIQREAVSQTAAVFRVGADIDFTQTQLPNRQAVNVTLKRLGISQNFRLHTPGVYQGLNTAVAYGAVAALVPNGPLQSMGIQTAVSRLRFPGRCDLVGQNPAVIIDGAINRESARLFRASVLAQVTHPLALVTALPQDKDFEGLLAELASLADQTIVTHVTAGHLHFTDEVVTVARRFSSNVSHEPEVDRAFALALETVGEAGTIWVVGTQSLVRDGLRFWQQDLESVMLSSDP